MSLQASNNAGASWLAGAGDYRYQYTLLRGASSTLSMTRSTSATSWTVFNFNGGTGGEGGNLIFDFYNLDNTGLTKWVNYDMMMYETNGAPNRGAGFGTILDNTDPVDGVRLTFNKATSAVRFALYEVTI